MSRIVVIILIYRRYNPIDFIYTCAYCQTVQERERGPLSPCEDK
jgi:hypothetical protein